MSFQQVEVELLPDSRLIVWLPKESRRLYWSGHYGKPLGIPKPKEDFEAPLILDPIEGVYLLEKDFINVVSGKDKKAVSLEEIKKAAKENLENFDDKYKVYKDLREKGLIVTPGIKYGCDFAVYKEGPGMDHAPFIIQVRHADETLSASKIVESGRLATTVRKKFIIASIDDDKISYLGFTWWKP
jgi:tRNA-intron endonuclease